MHKCVMMDYTNNIFSIEDKHMNNTDNRVWTVGEVNSRIFE